MRIEIKSTATAVRSGTGDNGRPWKITEQTGWAHCVDKEGNAEPYPQKVTLRLEEGVKAYAVGSYTLGDGSFYVGQYGRLSIGNLVLVPAVAAAAAARG